MKTQLFILCILLISCTNQYVLTKKDKEEFKKYPEAFLLMNGKKRLVDAYRIKKTDSLRKLHERDLTQEIIEEINQDQDYD